MANYMFQEKLTSNYTLINVPLKENINGPIIWQITCSPQKEKLTSNYTLINVPPLIVYLMYFFVYLFPNRSTIS